MFGRLFSVDKIMSEAPFFSAPLTLHQCEGRDPSERARREDRRMRNSRMLSISSTAFWQRSRQSLTIISRKNRRNRLTEARSRKRCTVPSKLRVCVGNEWRRGEVIARTSYRVSTADGESRRPAVLVANRAPRRSATTTASPDSRQTQRVLALRRPRYETR